MSTQTHATLRVKSTCRFIKEVIEVVANELNVPSDRIFSELWLEDLGADSLDRLGLAMRLEKAFGIFIRDDAIRRLRTVGDIVDLVGRAANKHV